MRDKDLLLFTLHVDIIAPGGLDTSFIEGVEEFSGNYCGLTRFAGSRSGCAFLFNELSPLFPFPLPRHIGVLGRGGQGRDGSQTLGIVGKKGSGSTGRRCQ